jgi:prepilin-type N-terminal cleavage/methylation domain-containing protein
MRERRASTPQAGFTLIETMIAIVVLVFGLIGVINLFVVAATGNFTANQMTVAAGLASEQMDRLKTVPFTTLVTGGDLNNDVSPAAACPGAEGTFSCLQNGPVNAGYGQIRLRWTITPLPVPAATSGIYAIVVEAFPVTGLAAGRARVTLTTIRTCTLASAGAGACPAIL